MSDDKWFNANRYTSGGDNRTSPYERITDGYANVNKMFVSFQHVPSGKQVYFKAFITAFNETYNSDWASETVYGRADPIYLFKNTTRQTALNFKIPAATESEAYENLGKVQKLIQFLYPNYTVLTDPVTCVRDVYAQTISQSPMIRMKVMNLLHDQKNADFSTGTHDKILNTREGTPPGANHGTLGTIANLTVNHNLEGDDGSFYEGPNTVLPKMIDIAITFNPIHEHPVGWNENRVPFNSMFPYGLNYSETLREAQLDAERARLVNAHRSATTGLDETESLAVETVNGTEEVPVRIKPDPAQPTAQRDIAAAATAQAMSGLGLDLGCVAARDAVGTGAGTGGEGEGDPATPGSSATGAGQGGGGGSGGPGGTGPITIVVPYGSQ